MSFHNAIWIRIGIKQFLIEVYVYDFVNKIIFILNIQFYYDKYSA